MTVLLSPLEVVSWLTTVGIAVSIISCVLSVGKAVHVRSYVLTDGTEMTVNESKESHLLILYSERRELFMFHATHWFATNIRCNLGKRIKL